MIVHFFNTFLDGAVPGCSEGNFQDLSNKDFPLPQIGGDCKQSGNSDQEFQRIYSKVE